MFANPKKVEPKISTAKPYRSHQFHIAAKRSHFRVDSTMEPHYELLNQRTRALKRAREQKPGLEIREAGTNCGDVDHVDGDVKLASNNLDTSVRRMSANINARN